MGYCILVSFNINRFCFVFSNHDDDKNLVPKEVILIRWPLAVTKSLEREDYVTSSTLILLSY